jgi:hypothetical protein
MVEGARAARFIRGNGMWQYTDGEAAVRAGGAEPVLMPVPGHQVSSPVIAGRPPTGSHSTRCRLRALRCADAIRRTPVLTGDAIHAEDALQYWGPYPRPSSMPGSVECARHRGNSAMTARRLRPPAGGEYKLIACRCIQGRSSVLFIRSSTDHHQDLHQLML